MENEILQYVEDREWEYKVSGDEIICKICPICANDNWNFQINKANSLYRCWICESDNIYSRGHLSKLKRYLGDIIDIKPMSVEDSTTPEVDFTDKTNMFHSDLKKHPPALKYLLKRGISKECIITYKLGYTVKNNQEWITIPSYEGGISKLIKYRKFGEDTAPERGKYEREKGGRTILFNGEALNEKTEAILTEGELDALTLLSNGYNNAVANTGGAGTFKPEWYDILKEMEKVYVCYDQDEVGQKNAKEVAKRLGFGKVYNITLPKGVNDINDYFVLHGGDVDGFDEILEDAKRFEIPGIISIQDSLRLVYESHLAGADDLVPTPWDNVNELLKGGFRKKNLIALGAPPKTGKTTLALQICMHASKYLNIPTLFFCLEMPFEELAMLAVCQNENMSEYDYNPEYAGLYSTNFKDYPIYLGYHPHILPRQVVETFTEARNRYGIGLAVFDNLTWLIRDLVNTPGEVGMITKMFKTLATQLEIPIILVAQPRKLTGDKPMNYWDFKDSSAIPADADVLCIMHRQRIEEEGEGREAFRSETLFRVDAGRLTAGGQTFLWLDGPGHKFRRITEEAE